jgi:pimeloyl-ACP methyl ester carboxylesterase
MGHEYIYCHRALRQLALKLCEAGFPVLRFDFYGCGDSAGEGEEGRLPQWVDDVSTAIAEVRTRAGVAQVCLIGLRLGATLAFAAAAQRDDVQSLVLWDPVVVGTSYIAELIQLHSEALKHRGHKRRNTVKAEIFGFSLPETLRQELEQFNFLSLSPSLDTRILTLYSHESANSVLTRHLAAHGARVESEQVKTPKMWEPTIDGNLLVPNQPLRSIVAWTSRAHA